MSDESLINAVSNFRITHCWLHFYCTYTFVQLKLGLVKYVLDVVGFEQVQVVSLGIYCTPYFLGNSLSQVTISQLNNIKYKSYLVFLLNTVPVRNSNTQ